MAVLFAAALCSSCGDQPGSSSKVTSLGSSQSNSTQIKYEIFPSEIVVAEGTIQTIGIYKKSLAFGSCSTLSDLSDLHWRVEENSGTLKLAEDKGSILFSSGNSPGTYHIHVQLSDGTDLMSRITFVKTIYYPPLSIPPCL